MPLDPVLRALHRRRLSYRARVASPVLLGSTLGEPPPDIHLLGAFGEAPVLAIGNRIVPPADFTVDNEAIQWDTGSGPHRTTGMLRFGNRGVTAAGLVTTATSQLSVQMDLQPVFFDCHALGQRRRPRRRGWRRLDPAQHRRGELGLGHLGRRRPPLRLHGDGRRWHRPTARRRLAVRRHRHRRLVAAGRLRHQRQRGRRAHLRRPG